MPTTTNNGWTIPADTDLVKDGAAAIRTLGNAIDTTIGVYGAPGLVLLNTTSFSAVATQSINDVFSATYDNYKIIVNISNSSASGNLFMRMRVSGADNTNNEYTRTKFYVDQTNAFGSDSGSAGTSSFFIGGAQGTSGAQSALEFQAPFLTQRTKHITTASQSLNSYLLSGSTTVTTSYTGFTLLTDVSNITGTVSVYAYKK